MTAKIITIFNQKGGCGKTMTTMQVGGACALMGNKVLIIDMDRQGTSSIWSSQATAEDPFPAKVISLAPQREKMITEVSKFIEDFDLIFIDCPPAIESPIPWAALQISDIALIPVIPVMDNVWASREARDLAIRAKQENTTLRTFYLASCMRRGNLFKLCVDELSKDEEVSMLKASLAMRNAYPESQLYGSTVHALSKTSPASEEVDILALEILDLLGV